MNWIALWTLVKRENVRSIKIINQVIWPPIISSLLYLLVFGFSLGKNLEMAEVSYLLFLVPGLIMMNIIMTSYEESSSSMFLAKFINYIQELLIAPVSYLELVLGFVIGGVIRAAVIANLIFLVFSFFVQVSIFSIGYYIYFMFMVSVLFGSIGLVVALWAEKFDHLAVLNTFFITPLLFLGGVFYSVGLLPEGLRAASLFNPLVYMIDGFRYSIIGVSDTGIGMSMGVTGALAVFFFGLAAYLMKKGYKLRT